jgi:hypothetical protein
MKTISREDFYRFYIEGVIPHRYSESDIQNFCNKYGYKLTPNSIFLSKIIHLFNKIKNFFRYRFLLIKIKMGLI